MADVLANSMACHLRATLHGAATWRIQWHDSRATCHIAGCCHRRIQRHVIPDPRTTLQGVLIPFAILKIVFRHIFCFFLMQFGLWRAARLSYRLHLFVDISGLRNSLSQSRLYLFVNSVCRPSSPQNDAKRQFVNKSVAKSGLLQEIVFDSLSWLHVKYRYLIGVSLDLCVIR